MKNFIAIVIMSIVLLSSCTIAGGTRPPENKYVKCDIVLQKKQLKAGTTGQLLITLKPIRGIHVNTIPPAEVKLDSANIIAGVGKLEIPKSEKTGYMDTKKQITLPFTLTQNLKAGHALLKGTLTYFFCSDADGWCSKFKQPIELNITIVK